MIWLTWRQLRAQTAVTCAILAVLVITLAVTAGHVLNLDHAYASASTFLSQLQGSGIYGTLYLIGSLAVILTPAVIGAFWGAPLIARELDAGTHWLAWNQSVTRTRWLAAKLALTGLTAMAATGLLSLAVTWWCSPVDTAVDKTTTSIALWATTSRACPGRYSTPAVSRPSGTPPSPSCSASPSVS